MSQKQNFNICVIKYQFGSYLCNSIKFKCQYWQLRSIMKLKSSIWHDIFFPYQLKHIIIVKEERTSISSAINVNFFFFFNSHPTRDVFCSFAIVCKHFFCWNCSIDEHFHFDVVNFFLLFKLGHKNWDLLTKIYPSWEHLIEDSHLIK